MENFVLNLFSDQLSKVILNFNDAKTKINASFMAGKGSITDVKLNVDLINDLLTKPPHGAIPCIQLSEVTLTELRLEVTSYANLKKAPVVLVVDEIRAHAIEPLEYHFGGRSGKSPPPPTAAAATATNTQATKPQYGLLHRIQDNLSVRVNRIELTFQPLGKFKTRREGPWTPPPLAVTLKNVEWISVTQHGNAGTPEQVWAHNDLSAQQSQTRRDAASGHRHRTYTIFKKLSMVARVGLAERGGGADGEDRKGLPPRSPPPLVSDCGVDARVAYARRLRDAGVAGVDVDVLVGDASVRLDLSPPSAGGAGPSPSTGCGLRSVVHWMSGLRHCACKDRSFVDPLLPNGVSRSDGGGRARVVVGDGPASVETVGGGGEELGPDDFMPAIDVEDDELDESSEDEEEPDEEHDEAFLAWKKEQGLVADEAPVADEKAERENRTISESMTSIQKEGSSNAPGDSLRNSVKSSDAAPSQYKRKRKAVIVLASGAQKFEKLSFSLTLRRVNAKLFLPREECDGTNRRCLELLAEGIVTECIWPKPSGEIGGNVQCSLRYMHIMEATHEFSGRPGEEPKESVVVRYCPVMKIGSRLFQGHDVFSLSSHWDSMMGGDTRSEIIDDNEDGFPMMEKRQVSWKWSRSNTVSGPCAVSLKSTVSFVDEKLALWSKTFVIHEASIGEIEICVDSDPIGRLVKAISSVPWDERWFSGDWLDIISPDMVAVPELSLSDHVQPLPAFLGTGSTKLSMLSSELRHVTARFGGVVVRLPHPVHYFSSAGLADVVCSVSSATVLVTSELPRSFLTGTIAVDGTTSKFPNDASDLSCKDSECDGSGAGAIFRMQVSLTDFSLKVLPTQQLPSCTGESNINNLIAPTKITIIMSLEHNRSVPQPESSSGPAISQSLATSVLIQRLESNVALQRAVSAASTISHQISRIMQHVSLPSSSALDGPSCNKSQLASLTDERLSKTTGVVCLHLPSFVLNLFDDRQTGTDSNGTKQMDALHLSRIRIAQIEFGLESTGEVIAGLDDGRENAVTVHKCSVEGFSLQVMSKDHALIDIVTTGTEESDSDESIMSEANVKFRACHSSLDGETVAAHVASPLMVHLDIDTIKFFTDHLASALSSPVYFYARGSDGHDTFDATTQSSISALWSSIYELSTSFGPSCGACKPKEPEPDANATETAIYRLILSNVSVQVPKARASSIKATYLFAFEDVEATFGCVGLIRNFSSLLKQQCGGGVHWRTLLGSDPESGAFYVIKSTQSLISVDGDSQIIVPSFSVDWDSNKSDAKTRNLIESFLNITTVMPSLSMKLYFLIPRTSSKSDVASAARNLHSMVGSYHNKVLKLISALESKVERMSLSLFAKEKERVGMMSLVTPVVSGWLRVGEGSDLSFHRLFATATLWRYWAVLKNSLLVFYESPGSPSPTLIFPLATSTTSIRTISIPSASNGSIGIVGTYLQQKGFALVDSDIGAELFCVAGSHDEFANWVSAISDQLKPDVPERGVSSDEKYQGGLTQTEVTEDVGQTIQADDTMNPSLPMTSDVTHSESSTATSNHLLEGSTAKSHDAVVSGDLDQSCDHKPTQPVIPREVGPTEPPLPVSHPMTHDDLNIARTPSYDQDMEDVSLDNESVSDSFLGPSILSTPEMEDTAVLSAPHQAGQPSNAPVPETQSAQGTKTPAIPSSRELLSKKSRFASADTAVLSAPHQAGQPSNAPVPETQSAQGTKTPAIPSSRELLSKKSRFASAKFSSALKTATEIGKQALSNDGNAANSTGSIAHKAAERSALAGQKFSALKKNANTRMSKLGTVVHSQVSQRAGSINSAHSSNPRLNESISHAESTGLEPLGSESDLLTLDASNSDRASQPSRQEQLRKKLTDLDQSMTTTMRRLKIDEKITNISTAVKNAANESQEGLQRVRVSMSQSKSSHPQTLKSINLFDARQTFSSHSELPVRVKSIKSDSSLILHDKFLCDKSKELEQFDGDWFVEVEPVRVVLAEMEKTEGFDTAIPGTESDEHSDASQVAQSTQPANPRLQQWNYKITSTELTSEPEKRVSSVEKSSSEILMFHALVSEILSTHLKCAAEVTYLEAAKGVEFIDPIFHQLAPLERIRVSGTILHGVLNASKPSDASPTIRQSKCELIKVFVYTLISSSLPPNAIKATQDFLDIGSSTKVSAMQDTTGDNKSLSTLASTTSHVNDSFGRLSKCVDELQKQPLPVRTQANALACNSNDSVFSSLLATMIMEYTNVVHERDRALASLAAASMLKENEVVQKYAGTATNIASQAQASQHSNSDEEMLVLCQNLGQEIGLRTTAEAEVESLKQRLELEQKLAETKECELLAEVERYKGLLKSFSSGK